MTEIHEGGCICGAIRYRVTGQPKNAFVCHCTYCQHASGSAFQMPVFFLKEDVEFSGEAPSTYDYQSPIHHRIIQTQFCSRCGTRIASTISRAPAFQLISGGTFDDLGWFKIDLHMFTESALPWMTFPADVRCYEKHFITEAGEKVKPLPRQSEPWCFHSEENS